MCRIPVTENRVERAIFPIGVGDGVIRQRLVDVVDGFRQMLTDVADIADDEDIGAELLLHLQVELLSETRLEIGSFGYKRQTGDGGKVRDLGRRRGYGNRDACIEGAVRSRKAGRVLARR